eukprot:g6629.t1
MIGITRAVFSRSITSGFIGARFASTVVLPDLPYDYSELEPYISSEIMELHHKKHHATYVKNLNIALAKQEEAENNNDLETSIALQSAIRFNGGGHINHSIFWRNLCPPKNFRPPEGQLVDAINQRFGSLEQFINTFNVQTAAVQGSGWGWLAYNKDTKSLTIETRPNQDPLTVNGKVLVPLLGVDVWEHAYYLQYKNVRPDYLKAIWKIVNWKDVESRFLEANN